MIRQENWYDLTAYLQDFKDLSIFAAHKIKNNYPLLNQTIDEYSEKIRDLGCRTPIDSHIRQLRDEVLSKRSFEYADTQIYTQEIKLYNGSFYKLSWSVLLAKETIQRYQLSPISFFTEVLAGAVDRSTLNESYLAAAARNDAPVIVAYFPMKPDNQIPFIIIDGSYRVIGKHRDGQEKIIGYCLNHTQHLEALVSPVQSMIYKIHYNCTLLSGYLLGKLSQTEMEERLLEV
jgi:hypothetical protein